MEDEGEIETWKSLASREMGWSKERVSAEAEGKRLDISMQRLNREGTVKPVETSVICK